MASAPCPTTKKKLEVPARCKQVRGEALVERLLEATLNELVNNDYRALSIERIAEAAGVNKTTLYRRWGTLEALVGDACRRLVKSPFPLPDTGSLASDLLSVFHDLHELLITPRLQGPLRLHFSGKLPEELQTIHDSIKAQKEQEMRTIFRRAVARGELPKDTDIELAFHVMGGAIMHLTLFDPEGCDDARIMQVIDMVLGGATHGAGRRKNARAPRR